MFPNLEGGDEIVGPPLRVGEAGSEEVRLIQIEVVRVDTDIPKHASHQSCTAAPIEGPDRGTAEQASHQEPDLHLESLISKNRSGVEDAGLVRVRLLEPERRCRLQGAASEAFVEASPVRPEDLHLEPEDGPISAKPAGNLLIHQHVQLS